MTERYRVELTRELKTKKKVLPNPKEEKRSCIEAYCDIILGEILYFGGAVLRGGPSIQLLNAYIHVHDAFNLGNEFC